MIPQYPMSTGLNVGKSFELPLMGSILPSGSVGSGTPTYTRATPASIDDWEGVTHYPISGEARFRGMRRVQNSVFTTSRDINNAIYVKRNGQAVSAVDATGLCPVTATGSGGNQGIYNESVTSDPPGTYTFRCRAIAGTVTQLQICIKDRASDTVRATANVPISATGSGTIVSITASGVTTSGCRAEVTAFGGTGTYWVGEWQVENVNGQSNQNPAEYISKGVLAAPFVQTPFGYPLCCNVDGTAYIPWQNGNTVSANVVTEKMGPPLGTVKQQSAFLPNPPLATNWFSTPNSSASSFSGDFAATFSGAIRWQTVPPADLVCKDHASGGPRCFGFQINAVASGRLRFFYTPDGTNTGGRVADSSVSVPFADSTLGYVGVTFISATGAVSFYTSLDGITWTQLGATVALTAGTIFIGNTTVTIGASDSGAQAPFDGLVYRVKLFNAASFTGTPVIDFNAQDASTSSNTWVSSTTGETWTKNGNALIINNPCAGYFGEPPSTNLALQNSTLNNAVWAATGATIGGSIVVPDGSTATVNKIQEDTSTGLHGIKQAFTKAASALSYVATVYARQAERTFVLIQILDGTNGSQVWVDLTSGAISNASTFGVGFTGAAVTVLPAPFGFWRITLTTTSSTSTVLQLAIYAATASSISSYTGVAGSGIYAWGTMLEQAIRGGSLIPTTTVAVSRNADLLDFSSVSNAVLTQGWALAEVSYPFSTPGVTQSGILAINDGTGNNRVDFRYNGANAFSGFITSGGVNQVTYTSPAGTFSVGPFFKLSGCWSAATCKLAMNGVLGTNTAMATPPAAFTTIHIGSLDNDSNVIGATIRGVRIYTVVPSDAEQIALTT